LVSRNYTYRLTATCSRIDPRVDFSTRFWKMGREMVDSRHDQVLSVNTTTMETRNPRGWMASTGVHWFNWYFAWTWINTSAGRMLVCTQSSSPCRQFVRIIQNYDYHNITTHFPGYLEAHRMLRSQIHTLPQFKFNRQHDVPFFRLALVQENMSNNISSCSAWIASGRCTKYTRIGAFSRAVTLGSKNAMSHSRTKVRVALIRKH
jgi:hypothetical protein